MFFGKDKAANTYVLSKNGWSAAPQILKLTDLCKHWPYGGYVRNPENHSIGIDALKKGKGGTSYYNPKSTTNVTGNTKKVNTGNMGVKLGG